MRHRVAGRHLSRPTGQRLALFRGLLTDLFRHERIKTTEAKAKAIQPLAERLVTLAKRGDLHARRLAAARLYDRQVVQKLFDDIAPRYAEQPGGYTRVVRLGQRLGDAAMMAQIELVPSE
ncbi:MAG: 50S ribosomal protein L17 [Chloroflexi bacterium]|nr:50S ribosomal protein L17 [Chloroflexota bacterium]